MRKQVFNVTYEHKITAPECNATALKSTLLVPIDAVRENFIHCMTRYSLQGTSLDESLAIFE
jgi:hypothetical protein